jgi:hypothetical protein
MHQSGTATAISDLDVDNTLLVSNDLVFCAFNGLALQHSRQTRDMTGYQRSHLGMAHQPRYMGYWYLHGHRSGA